MKGSSGISWFLTRPQQNGVVERRNRTVMAMIRSLLKVTHMLARFWGEVVRHAIYLLNCLPTKVLGERTPFEAWMGRKPHLVHLRVFGCVAYVKNTASHLKKLDDSSSPMVYLGVEESCKAHRLFDPRHGKLQFMVVDAFDTDEVIVATNIEAGAEDVRTLAISVVPMTGASSPSTPSSNTHAASSSSITNSPESYEGPVRFRSIVDIYANTEEVVGIAEEEGEAEFMVATTAVCHALWLRSLASELTSVKPKSVTLFVDNKSVIALMKNLVFHCRSKHIDTRFHFIREYVEKGQIVVEFVNTEEQRADVLTKALPGVKLAVMRQLLGVRDLEPCQD
ncbi:hypothetical protein ZIOFF_057429 [Zingiber officinale]|uniref:Integrase catalytic domain-containing protein n=1 Tax=Zingiber officinale TaxID=94328 RepID=A0A8J5KBS3_ZINOF|nr:hypothetical protein ZIOFF_057429 [Zingiber officinale]